MYIMIILSVTLYLKCTAVYVDMCEWLIPYTQEYATISSVFFLYACAYSVCVW